MRKGIRRLMQGLTFERHSAEKGVVLILLALLATVLLLITGLAIDVNILKAARREQTSLAPAVATAALSTYSKTSGDEVTKLQAAHDRAEDIAQINVKLSNTTAFLKDSNPTQELGPRITGGTVAEGDEEGPSGKLVPGIWHFRPTWQAPYFVINAGTGDLECVGPTPCPCDTNKKWNGPCFETLDVRLVGGWAPKIPSAFYTELKLREDSPLATTFMHLSGQKYMTMASGAIVTTRPLRTVFLVDLSRYTHMETHLPYEIVAAGMFFKFNPAEYAYKIGNKSCVSDPPYSTFFPDPGYDSSLLTCLENASPPACLNGVSSGLKPTDCTLVGGKFEGLYNQLFNFYCGTRPLFVPQTNPGIRPYRWHTRSDYRCYSITYQEGTDAQKTDHYLADVYRGVTKDLADYQGPEPLNSMLAAVQGGLAKVEERKIDGDFTSIIGFDHRADMDIRRFPLSDINSADFTKMKTLAASSGNLTERHRDRFFFSREDAMLDIPEALSEAYDLLLSKPDHPLADNLVVLITTGVSNCYIDDTTNDHVCSNTAAAVEESIDEAVDFVTNNYIPYNIRLSVIMVNQMVRPHTLLRRGNLGGTDDRCMETAEAMENNLALSDAQTNSDSAAMTDPVSKTSVSDTGDVTFNAFYMYPNKLEEAVRKTNGIWGVVRDACNPDDPGQLAGGSSCADGGLVDYLDSKCAALSNPGDLLTSEANITDADGRLYCDPKCRSRAAQISAYIDEIFDRNPFTPVAGNIRVQ